MVLMARGTSRFRLCSGCRRTRTRVQRSNCCRVEVGSGSAAGARRRRNRAAKALAMNSEFAQSWPADVRTVRRSLASCWRLAAITPVTALDQIAMLQAARSSNCWRWCTTSAGAVADSRDGLA